MKPLLPYDEILKKLRQRDTSVLAALLEQYGGKMVGYAQRQWQFSAEESSELIYQTFDVLLRRTDPTIPSASTLSFEAQPQFDAFVFGIFINKLREAHRQRNREAQRYIPIDQLEPVNSDDADEGDERTEPLDIWFESDDSSDDHKRLAQMDEALATLPPEDRSLLLLWAQGFSYSDIGGKLGLNPQHLNVRCFRAKQRVIKWFSEHAKQTQL
ncbi:RNA polymerase sigma factor [Fibrella forsythiae]|uniref:Sigma-70 family RNA polymerase sigma factor n=1 Tax=Fibrella forsythiae TaxID=2817061 RepID=A0ABS3JJE0_9BACT|nr:sigma-70 family RNA polymerase sigma factor [Fibrella forsythiae]MBO0950124.1 sigma-70 family RNA polymerase sigma factor [Fibrella forsythiae]